MAIFIGCLGLLGLVMFMTNQRTKEIGVRKILGASAESVVLLLSKEFAKLILLGFAFAAPLAGLLMHKILEEFAYKTDLGPSVFLMSLLSTCMIAFVTVAYRSFIAATANPIESLRSE
jgi:ABC-type antimicrobial peptide transport system permease subunit